MFKKLIIVSLLLVSSVSAQPLLTLEEAVSLGLKNNYNIQIARNQEQIAENNTRKGIAGFLPKVDLSANISKVDSEQEMNSPSSTINTDIDNINAELQLNWVLFDGFTMFVNRNRFNELAELTKYQTRDKIENLIVQISHAYFNVVLQEQLYRVLSDIKEISATRLARERVRNQIGGASSTDLYNAQVAYNSDQSALLHQELEVTIARDRLNVLLGRDPATEFVVTDEIIIPEFSLSLTEVSEKAIERNSTLKSSEFSKKIAERNVQAARAPFLPRLSLFSRYSYNDRGISGDADLPVYLSGSETIDFTVGLSLTYNLFNGQRDKIDLQNAKIEKNNRELACYEMKNQILGLSKELFDTYQQRMELVTLEEDNIKAAEKNLELQTERHDLGVANSLEFRDAQVNFARAKTSLFTARFQTRISRLELEQLIGMLEIE